MLLPGGLDLRIDLTQGHLVGPLLSGLLADYPQDLRLRGKRLDVIANPENHHRRLSFLAHNKPGLPLVRLLQIEKSWERIFDLEALDRSDWIGPVHAIQATVAEIPMEAVLRVRRFTVR